MNSNDNNPQQPDMGSFPVGFNPNQMMQQQFFPPLPMNQLAGMQFNGAPAAPQMMPNFSMFYNPFQSMGGMPQQLFNPMQFAGQMPMLPPMGDQFAGAQPMFPPMGGQLPLMGAQMGMMGGQMVPSMGGQMPPFVQYVLMPVQMPCPIFPPNEPVPAPIPIKTDIKDEPQESVIECTPPHIAAKFSIAEILERKDVKNEPIDQNDQEDRSIPNTTTNSHASPPIKNSDSATHSVELPPPSPINTDAHPSLIPDDIPDTPASPDGRNDHYEQDQDPEETPSQQPPFEQVDHSVMCPTQSATHEQPLYVECDEYLSADETVGMTLVETPLVTPTHPYTRATPDRLLIVESSAESLTSSREVRGAVKEEPRWEEEESMETQEQLQLQLQHEETREEMEEVSMEEDKGTKVPKIEPSDSNDGALLEGAKEHTEPYSPYDALLVKHSESTDALLVPTQYRASSPPMDRPSIPPRFPVRRPQSDEDRRSRSREPISPWRMIRSPIRRGGRGGKGRAASPLSSPRRSSSRATNPLTVLVKGVPSRLDDKRIERFFADKYGRCKLSNVHGEPGTKRIEFGTKRDRDGLYESRRSVNISGERLTVHEDVTSEKSSSSREKAGPSRESRSRHSPSPVVPVARIPSSEKCSTFPFPNAPQLPIPSEKTDGNKTEVSAEPKKREELPPTLQKCDMLCDRYKKYHILTAGPIPLECSLNSVVAYFRSLLANVMDVPLPVDWQTEEGYLVLGFNELGQAKKVLAAQEVKVDGHCIPVYPPYDVYLLLNGSSGLEPTELMQILQAECGVLVSLPKIHNSPKSVYGYATFGRPQDGKAAASRHFFTVGENTFKVAESAHNRSFQPYQDIWEVKCKLEEQSREAAVVAARWPAAAAAVAAANPKPAAVAAAIHKLAAVAAALPKPAAPAGANPKPAAPAADKKKKNNTLKKGSIKDVNLPILTIGPIPDHCLAECDEHLLSTYDGVYEIPYRMRDGRHFRILTMPDAVVSADLLREGYLRVGKDNERILISPSYDVIFKSALRHPIDFTQLVQSMQRKYGPLVRELRNKSGGCVMASFGRIQDALRAIEESPHFKRLEVHATDASPNLSFKPFMLCVDMQVLVSRAREAEMMEEAANIRVSCHTSSEESQGSTNTAKRSRTEESVDDDVLVCSPVRKQSKPEDISVSVRVSDPEQWIPDKGALVKHFEQFGRIAKFDFKDHLEAFVQFDGPKQAQKALAMPHVKVAGRWLDVTPSSSA